jgi:hypothetical protein
VISSFATRFLVNVSKFIPSMDEIERAIVGQQKCGRGGIVDSAFPAEPAGEVRPALQTEWDRSIRSSGPRCSSHQT